MGGEWEGGGGEGLISKGVIIGSLRYLKLGKIK